MTYPTFIGQISEVGQRILTSPNKETVNQFLGINTGLNTGFDCFLFIGQSNCEGNGIPLDLVYDYPDPRILNYSPGTETYSNKLILAEYNLLNIQGQRATTRISFALTFAKQVLLENNTRPLVLLSCALGNTGFSSNHWKVGDPLYNTTVNHVNSFLSLYPGSVLKGILWHQGERDHDNIYPAESYQANLEAMILGMRTQITNAANCPFVCGNYSPGWSSFSSLKSDMEDVNFQLTRRLPYTGNVLSTGLEGNFNDVIHFSAASQRELGRRYFAQWKFAQTNVLTVPAAVTNVNVQQLTSTSLQVSWTPDNRTDSVLVQAKVGLAVISSNITSTSNQILLTGLEANNTYSIEITAQNNIGNAPTVRTTGTTNNNAVFLPLNPLVVLNYENPAALGFSSGSISMGTTDNVNQFIDPQRGRVLALLNNTPGGVLAYTAPGSSFPSTRLSFATWANITQYANDACFFGISGGSDTGRAYFVIDEVANLELFVNNISVIKLPGKFRKKVWQHVAFTIGDGLAKVYVDGFKLAEAAATISIASNNNPIFIGESNFNYGCITGYMDSTRIYSQTLSDSQIIKLYEETR
jgi:hypothetical protein